MKRKDMEFDHVDHDDVFDFTLSSPACKIRRLDALPTIMEGEEADIPFRFEQQQLPEFRAFDGGESRSNRLVIEELPPDAENQERAIVLFKPMDTPLYHSPSQFVVDSDIISSIRDKAPHWIYSNSSRYVEDVESKADEQLAVIPWVPSQRAMPPEASEEVQFSEPMEAEEMAAPMEAEGNIVASGVQSMNEHNQPLWSNGTVPQQWQQQHCMIPQPPQNITTPIVWYK